jgi:hypothetical protein
VVAAPDGGYFFDGHYFQAKVIQTQLFWTRGYRFTNLQSRKVSKALRDFSFQPRQRSQPLTVVIFLTAIIFRRRLYKPNRFGQEGNPFYKSSIPQGLKSLADFCLLQILKFDAFFR